MAQGPPPQERGLTPDEARDLIPIKEAAAYLGVSRKTLDRLTNEGHVTYVRRGRGVGRKMFLTRWLVDYLNAQTVHRNGD